LLWHGTTELLRQEGATYSGLTMRRDADISGDRDQACIVPEMWEGEAGEDRVVIRQSLLHKEVCLLCRHMKQANQYTIRNISPQLDQALKSEAFKAKKSVNQYVVETLEAITGLAEGTKHHDFDFLIGSWVKDPLQDKILKEQRKIDKDLWK